MKKLIMAIAVMSLVGTGFAAVENIKVSGDINAEAIARDFTLDQRIQDNADEFIISQIGLRFDADLTEGVSAVLRLLSQETWGEDNADDMEIDLGYIELKEFLYDPLTLIVGKQNLRYGSALVVGDPDTNQGNVNDPATGLPAIATDLSMRKSFDAVRGILDFAPWTIDLVFAQIDETEGAPAATDTVGTAIRHDDEYLFGINAAYDWSSYNGVTELYLFAADRTPRTTSVEEDDQVYTIGSRVQFDPNDNWTLGVEGAYQFGTFRRVYTNNVAAVVTDQDKINAFAAILGVDYRFLNDYNAKLGLKYTHLSGDQTDTDATHQAWVTLWEDQSSGEILNVLMDHTNARLLTLTGSLMPREDITLGALYTLAYLDKELPAGLAGALAAYTPAGGPASIYAYTIDENRKFFGQELDVYAIYDYTEDVQIKLSGAFFDPGDLFSLGTFPNNDTAYSVRAGVSVDF